MNFRKTGLLITIALVIILFTLNRQPVELVSQTDFKCRRISAAGYELSWVMHLYNPNLLSSTIQRVNQKVMLNGKELTELQLELGQGIPGRKETSFPVSVRLAEADSGFGNAPLVLLLKGEIGYSNLTGGGTVQVNEMDSVVVE